MYFWQTALSTCNRFFTAKLAKHDTKINLCTKGRKAYFLAQWVETPQSWCDVLEPLCSGCRRLEPRYSCAVYWNPYILRAVYWNLYILVAEGWNLYILGAVYIGTPVPWERCTETSRFWVRCTGTWSADVGWLSHSAGQLVPADLSAGCPGRGQHAHRSSAGDQPTLSALSSSYLDNYITNIRPQEENTVSH